MEIPRPLTVVSRSKSSANRTGAFLLTKRSGSSKLPFFPPSKGSNFVQLILPFDPIPPAPLTLFVSMNRSERVPSCIILCIAQHRVHLEDAKFRELVKLNPIEYTSTCLHFPSIEQREFYAKFPRLRYSFGHCVIQSLIAN